MLDRIKTSRFLPALVVMANLMVFVGVAFLIVRIAYQEDEYGIPGGTPVTGIEVLFKLIMVLMTQVVINIMMHRYSTNRLVKSGILFTGAIFLAPVLIWLLIRLVQ